MTTKVIRHGEGFVIDHQPGNATKYLLTVTPMDEDHYCVSWPEMNVSMILSCVASLDVGYFHEKLNRSRKYDISEVDCSEIIKAVRHLQMFKDCPIRVCTDLRGRYRETYRDPAKLDT
jgi:hypothetical protein